MPPSNKAHQTSDFFCFSMTTVDLCQHSYSYSRNYVCMHYASCVSDCSACSDVLIYCAYSTQPIVMCIARRVLSIILFSWVFIFFIHCRIIRNYYIYNNNKEGCTLCCCAIIIIINNIYHYRSSCLCVANEIADKRALVVIRINHHQKKKKTILTHYFVV